nr:probable rRNA-processing protein EBP2 [Procambarus clarkii]
MASDSGEEYSDTEYSDIDEREANEEHDSDVELQEAFSRGELKPGLHVLNEKVIKEFKNDVNGLKQKLAEFKLSLPWTERFDITNPPAPLAPELDAELLIQKVRKRLMQKQVGQQISERVKKIREIKKYGKKVQVEVEQQKHKEKREMLEKIKKFRKGKTDTIDFLEDGAPLREGGSKTKSQLKKDMKRARGKRIMKDKKYGFGGKKRNIKRNTAKSFADDQKMPAMLKPGARNKRKGRPTKGNKNKSRARS